MNEDLLIGLPTGRRYYTTHGVAACCVNTNPAAGEWQKKSIGFSLVGDWACCGDRANRTPCPPEAESPADGVAWGRPTRNDERSWRKKRKVGELTLQVSECFTRRH